jgi:hypothetical protein
MVKLMTFAVLDRGDAVGTWGAFLQMLTARQRNTFKVDAERRDLRVRKPHASGWTCASWLVLGTTSGQATLQVKDFELQKTKKKVKESSPRIDSKKKMWS